MHYFQTNNFSISCWTLMIWGLIWDPSFWVTQAEMTGWQTPQARPRAILGLDKNVRNILVFTQQGNVKKNFQRFGVRCQNNLTTVQSFCSFVGTLFQLLDDWAGFSTEFDDFSYVIMTSDLQENKQKKCRYLHTKFKKLWETFYWKCKGIVLLSQMKIYIFVRKIIV